jgi:hypothetical protein
LCQSCRNSTRGWRTMAMFRIMPIVIALVIALALFGRHGLGAF